MFPRRRQSSCLDAAASAIQGNAHAVGNFTPQRLLIGGSPNALQHLNHRLETATSIDSVIDMNRQSGQFTNAQIIRMRGTTAPEALGRLGWRAEPAMSRANGCSFKEKVVRYTARDQMAFLDALTGGDAASELGGQHALPRFRASRKNSFANMLTCHLAAFGLRYGDRLASFVTFNEFFFVP